jgi:DNA-binding transcriptional ArsR family regulator
MATFLYESQVDSVLCEAYNDDPKRVARVARAMPSQKGLTALAEVCSALAHPIRAAVYAAISKEPLCVCELSALLGASSPALMHHLRHMDRAGLITVRKEGKFAVYEPTSAMADAIIRAFKREQPELSGAKR